MKVLKAFLESAAGSAYSPNKPKQVEKGEAESHQQFEERTFRLRVHVNTDGLVVIPPMCFKNSLSEIAKYKGEKIPGRRGATYTKHFEAGVMVFDDLITGLKADAVEPEWLYLPSDGKRGGTTRVWRCFPKVPRWEGVISYHIFDPELERFAAAKPDQKNVVEEHIRDAGIFIGLGRFRPKNNGFYGRYKVNKFSWSDS